MPHQARHDQNPHARIRRISYETYASPWKLMLWRCGIFDRLQHQPPSSAKADRRRGGLAGTTMLTDGPTVDIVRPNERRANPNPATPKPANDSQPDFPI
jgi:hypothetical protein